MTEGAAVKDTVLDMWHDVKHGDMVDRTAVILIAAAVVTALAMIVMLPFVVTAHLRAYDDCEAAGNRVLFERRVIGKVVDTDYYCVDGDEIIYSW